MQFYFYTNYYSDALLFFTDSLSVIPSICLLSFKKYGVNDFYWGHVILFAFLVNVKSLIGAI